MKQHDLIIIGGGLTGLCLQYLLSKESIDAIILEARGRLGGRILTSRKPNCAPIELGATWFGDKHKNVLKLLEELDIQKFPQELSDRAIYEPISTSPHQLVSLPPNQSPSFRIKDGTDSLIQQLTAKIDQENIYLNQQVKSIRLQNGIFTVACDEKPFSAKIVVSTLPPFLLHKTVKIEPQLPGHFQQIMQQTHTWMGESIKFGLNFDKAFWRNENLSGTLFSNVGPIPEMYDHSNFEDNSHALKGFLNGSYFSLSKEDRSKLIINQLKKYYGAAIENYVQYQELVWRNEAYTFVEYESSMLPHQNNGHVLYQDAYLNEQFIIAGSECSSEFPGYMEGAISSARKAFEKIKNSTLLVN